jgi:hypothetical protein
MNFRDELPGPAVTRALRFQREQAHARRDAWMATPLEDVRRAQRRQLVKETFALLGIIALVCAAGIRG